MRVIFCVLALCAPVAAGCAAGDDGQDGGEAAVRTAPVLGEKLPPEVRHPVTQAIDRLQRTFAQRDYSGFCALVTPTAARDAGEAAHGDATTCKRDVRRLFDLIRDGGGWRHVGAPRVIDVTQRGDTATALVALDRRWQAQVAMARRDGRWRLDGLFGTPRRPALRISDSTPDSEFPPPRGTPLEVSGSDDALCPDLSEAGYPKTAGGCRLRLTGAMAPLTMLTPFGDFQFERCSIAYTVRVDSSGRTWTEDFDVDSNRETTACGDVNACYDYDLEDLVPWRGRLHASGDDTLVHEMDMCLSTCVGYFVGKLEMRLERDDDGWRATPINGGGDTGFRFDNPLTVKGDLAVSEPS